MIHSAAPRSAHSRRNSSLTQKFRDKSYRHSYMSAHVKTFLANQLRALRGDMSQVEFGRKIGKPQPVVNRNENTSYGKFSLQTLLDIGEKLDLAVHVRFVDFPTFIELTEDLSEAALKPSPYTQARAIAPVINTSIGPGTGSLNLTGSAPEASATYLEAHARGSASAGSAPITIGARGGFYDPFKASSIQHVGIAQSEILYKAANESLESAVGQLARQQDQRPSAIRQATRQQAEARL